MYKLKIEEKVDKSFSKIKEKKLISAINKKIEEILENPYHFKSLRNKLRDQRRVHIMKSFVLIYDINEAEQIVRILRFGHHDKVYK